MSEGKPAGFVSPEFDPHPERKARLEERGDPIHLLLDAKTSTGAEIRFFMPVLNVPFRLIFAENPQRGGVLNNQLLPAKPFTFRFAVGTTF